MASELDGRPSDEEMLLWYRQMLLIRRFEESAIALLRAGRVHGSVHPYVGEEAIAVGVMSALDPVDRIVSTHRGHGHLLAKGAQLAPMFGELLGRVGGYCRGRGGSMHIAAVDKGIMGANGIVAGGAGIALGSAFAAKRLGTHEVTVSFFGDGATGQGLLWESLFLSANLRLPILWVCENNQIAANTLPELTLPSTQVSELISERVLPTWLVDGNDVAAVRAATRWALARIRDGAGPALLECVTFRTLCHVYNNDAPPFDPRPEQLKDAWRRRDPLDRLERELRASSIDRSATVAAIAREVDDDIAAAIEEAEAMPFPDARDATKYVFATPAGG